MNNCLTQGNPAPQGACLPFETDCLLKMTELLEDIDTVLGCSETFMLGVEEKEALNWAEDETKNLTILNVRNQGTMWGPCE